MRILVIGGAGYIGSHFVRHACDAGHRVHVMDNLSTGFSSSIDQRATFWHGDMNNEEDCSSNMVFAKPNVVFCFAGLKAAGDSMCHPHEYAHTNIGGILNVLMAMHVQDVQNFVFSSSAAVYGTPKYTPIDELHPTNPGNFYGFTKLEIERILQWYSALHKIRYASLRYFNAAGYDVNPCDTFTPHIERDPTNLLPIVMETASHQRELIYVFGDDYDTPDGTGIRDYIHVNDLASAHLLASEFILRTDSDLIVNLGTETGYSVLQVLSHAGEIVGKTLPSKIIERRAGDSAKVISSCMRARKILKWQPIYSDIDTILKTMWRMYNG